MLNFAILWMQLQLAILAGTALCGASLALRILRNRLAVQTAPVGQERREEGPVQLQYATFRRAWTDRWAWLLLACLAFAGLLPSALATYTLHRGVGYIGGMREVWLPLGLTAIHTVLLAGLWLALCRAQRAGNQNQLCVWHKWSRRCLLLAPIGFALTVLAMDGWARWQINHCSEVSLARVGLTDGSIRGLPGFPLNEGEHVRTSIVLDHPEREPLSTDELAPQFANHWGEIQAAMTAVLAEQTQPSVFLPGHPEKRYQQNLGHLGRTFALVSRYRSQTGDLQQAVGLLRAAMLLADRASHGGDEAAMDEAETLWRTCFSSLEELLPQIRKRDDIDRLRLQFAPICAEDVASLYDGQAASQAGRIKARSNGWPTGEEEECLCSSTIVSESRHSPLLYRLFHASREISGSVNSLQARADELRRMNWAPTEGGFPWRDIDYPRGWSGPGMGVPGAFRLEANRYSWNLALDVAAFHLEHGRMPASKEELRAAGIPGTMSATPAGLFTCTPHWREGIFVADVQTPSLAQRLDGAEACGNWLMFRPGRYNGQPYRLLVLTHLLDEDDPWIAEDEATEMREE